MGLFKSLKGKIDVGTDDPSSTSTSSTREEYTAPTGPPPSWHPQGSASHEEYPAPQVPPPSQGHHLSRQEGHREERGEEDFLPPPGPPPSHLSPDPSSNFAPPPGPPPFTSDNPPPYHDWTMIPDTSLLPPPPPLPQDYSPTNNASYDSAASAHAWCAAHPLYTPSTPSHEIHLLANAGHIRLDAPPHVQLRKHLTSLKQTSPTSWVVATGRAQPDAVLMGAIPVYFARADHPAITGREKVIYFEIVVKKIRDDTSGIAIGFAAKPYPPWRLPGWHRASIGVHGDDGRRFMNDSWAGREFVRAFKEGETVGVGMRFEGVGGEGVKVTGFLTRRGIADPRWEWEVDEERDERDEGVEGLRGEGDLYPAIGVFGAVEFEVRFGDGVKWKE